MIRPWQAKGVFIAFFEKFVIIVLYYMIGLVV